MNYGRAYSPPCEGLRRRGVRAIKNGSIPKTARTGWSLTSDVSKCVLKHWLVSDHPVCGAFGGLRELFISCRSHPSFARSIPNCPAARPITVRNFGSPGPVHDVY